jgi:hypothetical protein
MNSSVRLAIRIASIAILVFVLYRRFHTPSPAAKAPDLIFSGPSSVAVTIAPDGDREWLATYTGDGHTARFKIVLNPSPADASGISFAKGRFIAVPGSDSSSLLVALKAALQARNLPQPPQRASELPFTYAGLGDHQSRNDDDSFSSKPAGSWIVTKLFLPNGDEEGEVFFNLNPSTNHAEFSIKDPDYGDAVLHQLATVL